MSTEPVTFRAVWDTRLLIWTIACSIVLLGGALVSAAATFRSPSAPRLIGFGIPVLLLAIFGFVWALAPRAYIVDDEQIRFRRWIGESNIPRSGLRSARRLADAELAGSLRTFGVGGLFGYYGSFNNGMLGDYSMFSTRSTDFVLIEDVTGARYVITPEHPDEFVRLVSNKLTGKEAR